MKKPKMTPKQAKLLKVTVLNPEATLEERALQAGYSGRQQAYRALKAPAVVSALEKCRALMAERENLSLGKMLDHLEEGLKATTIRSLKVEGTKFAVESEVVDHVTRHKWWESAMEIHGVTRSEEAVGPGHGGALNIAIILSGNGSDAEKDALADALLAARLSRGLHPLEDRKLTEEEAEQYRRPA